MPPCGMGLVRTSRMRRSASNSSEGLVRDAASSSRSATSLSTSPRPKSPRSAHVRGRSRRAARRPGRVRPAVQSSRNCRFQQISRMSWSNTLNALRDLVERRLQQVAVVLDRLGRIVEQLEGALADASRAPQQQRQHEARRGGADGAGQQVLGEAQHLDVGLGVAARKRSLRLVRILVERALRTLGAEIAADRCCRSPAVTDVRHSRNDRATWRGKSSARTRAPAAARSARAAEQRRQHEHDDVGGKAPQARRGSAARTRRQNSACGFRKPMPERAVTQEARRHPAGLDDPAAAACRPTRQSPRRSRRSRRAPWRLRQIRPPKNAGANWAMRGERDEADGGQAVHLPPVSR